MQRKVLLGLGLALVAAVVAVYLPALRAGFIWNDETYLTENPTLDSAEGLRLIWTEPKANEQYYPMVFTSFWLEKRLWSLRPFGYHLVNVLLHAGSALLMWSFLRRLGLPGAWLAAAVFALHPMCVESVAWVTERKNTLSLFLSFLALHAYRAALDARAKAAEPRKKRKPRTELPWYRRPGALYTGALVAFTLALFAKTTASVVPAVLLVLVWWRTGRVRAADVRPLVPFFAIGVGLALHTAFLERTMVRATGEEWALGLLGRVVLAGKVIAFYAGKLLVPTGLAFIYQRWAVDPHQSWQWLPATVAFAVLAAAWAFRSRIGRGPLTGVLLFGGVLFPAMGFFNVYAMRYSWVADHFAYQAVAVSAAFVVCGAASLAGIPSDAASAVVSEASSRAKEDGVPAKTRTAASSRTTRRAAGTFAVAVLAVLGAMTFRQSRVYRSEDTLWSDTLAKNPDCFMCHTNYGDWLVNNGRAMEAIGHFEKSLELRPDNVPTLLNLARVEEQRGRFDEAGARLRTALKIDPTDPLVLINLATINTKAGRFDEAIAEYGEALRLGSPDDYLAHNGLGAALMGKGKATEAVEHFREALRLKPDYFHARDNLERALAILSGRP